MITLESAWQRCFRDLGTTPPLHAFDELRWRYSEPRRAYHTLEHLRECFAWFDQVHDRVRAPGEVALALFYHDAIYDPRAADNEAKSAALAAKVLARRAAIAQRVSALILTTRHDAPAQDGDAQTLVDIDLSILGAPAPRFDEYERQVRAEYAHVADDAFREGRADILRAFLARPALYGTAYFHDRLEAPARANLRRSLEALG
jgi:predicted metal-dependent HD superfamily phosphohydrolase